jgi:hypothetical protein
VLCSISASVLCPADRVCRIVPDPDMSVTLSSIKLISSSAPFSIFAPGCNIAFCFHVLTGGITLWPRSTATRLPPNELLMVLALRCFCFSCYETRAKHWFVMAKQHFESVLTSSDGFQPAHSSVCVCVGGGG